MTAGWRIITGDCREVLPTLADGSAQTCITSPPYFGLRDYGHDDQIGLEPTIDAFVGEMVAVFREVRRVLRDDGTLWLNLGDSYGSTGGDTHSGFNDRYFGRTTEGGKQRGIGASAASAGRSSSGPHGRPKNLLGIPWRVAFALQADGWYLRQDIVWHKPNPMPESVRDRCTKAHEYLFLLSKSERYHYDVDAIMVPAAPKTLSHRGGGTQGKRGNVDATGRVASGRWAETTGARIGNERVNRRSVWTVPTRPYPGAHFATYPPELVEPCVLAGSSADRDGFVLDPFAGAGTTGAVAVKHGREFVGVELNPEYVELARSRIAAEQPSLFVSEAEQGSEGGIDAG